MSRRSTWAARWGKSWGKSWGLVDEQTAAAGKTKKRRLPRVGAPWHWVAPLPPLSRTRKKKEAELVAFLGS
jgi:hypothetical protein